MKLEIHNVSFAYRDGEELFRDLSFEVESGETLTILGPNGVGKTTLLKCLMGFLKVKKGRMQKQEDGRLIENRDEILKDVGYVPQKNTNHLSYTAEETILMGRNPKLNAFSVPSKKDVEIVGNILEEMKMMHLRDKDVSKLSGGELQLVYIARALVADPKVIMLDEPESNLDLKNQLVVLKMIENLVKTKNICCIINTHFPQHALMYSDKTIMLRGGGEYFYGKSQEVINVDNIKQVFGVDSQIINIEHNDISFKTLVPLDIAVSV